MLRQVLPKSAYLSGARATIQRTVERSTAAASTRFDFKRLYDVGLGVELHDRGIRQNLVHALLGADILQDGDAPPAARRLELVISLAVRARKRKQGHALDVVGTAEVGKLRTIGRDRHELNRDVDLSRIDVGNPCGRVLLNEFDLGFIGKKALGQDPGHGDVHADKVALLILKMPRSIGAAGSDNEMSAVEHCTKLAVRVCSGIGPAGRWHS